MSAPRLRDFRTDYFAHKLGFLRCQANCPLIHENFKRVTDRGGAHNYVGMGGGKFLLITTPAQLNEAYGRDCVYFFLTLVEKPQDRDFRRFVLDIDDVPPEIFKGGEIVTEIADVCSAVITERLEGVAPGDLIYRSMEKGPQFPTAHILFKNIVMKEDCALLITALVTEEMTTRYPGTKWGDIIDKRVTGANGVRMIGAYKVWAPKALRTAHPDIYEDFYRPDENGKATRGFNKFGILYKLPNIDKGVYMPTGHVGPLTGEIVEEHSIFPEAGQKTFEMKAEYA